MKNKTILAFCLITFFCSCKKNDDSDDAVAVSEKEILTDFANDVAVPNYAAIDAKANLLNTAVINLDNQVTDANLQIAQQAWRNMRSPWEQCEAWLFGPVEDYSYDPEIDSWPVNKVDLDSLLASSTPLDLPTIQGLQSTLKGFHPLEYMLFGMDGNKTAAQLTAREREYMKSLTLHLVGVAHDLYHSWDPSQQGNFAYEFINAGPGSTKFATKREAFITMISAMAGICDEVANGKMQDPLILQDPEMEESQFSSNSVTDFRNNLIGVKNVYFCMYGQDGTGLNEWVASKNLALDNKIQVRISAAVASFDNITQPYGQAIFTQQIQIQQAQDAINALKTTLEDELLVFVTNNIKD